MAIARFSLQTAAVKPGDIAIRLDVEPSTVYRWIRTGELPAFEVAGAKYILAPAYERFLERHKKGVTLEEQAQRHIGPGFDEEYEGEFDPLEGLSLPIRVPSADHDRGPISPAAAIEDARGQLRQQLDALEARFGAPSERIHRLYFVERQPHVEGVADELYSQWASLYAAYLELSLVHAR